MPRRKKHSRLPNGYGSIRYLGKNRKNPYAVHPPANIDGDRPAALCYVDDWMKGFIILTAYKAGTYKPGMERIWKYYLKTKRIWILWSRSSWQTTA